MQECNFLEAAFESITVWQCLDSPTSVYRVIGMFTCSPQIQTKNMNCKLKIIQDQEESYIYMKCWKSVQRRYVILEETFEFDCRFSCSEYHAVKRVGELEGTFIYFSSFSSLTLPPKNTLAEEAGFFHYLTGKCSHKNILE